MLFLFGLLVGFSLAFVLMMGYLLLSSHLRLKRSQSAVDELRKFNADYKKSPEYLAEQDAKHKIEELREISLKQEELMSALEANPEADVADKLEELNKNKIVIVSGLLKQGKDYLVYVYDIDGSIRRIKLSEYYRVLLATSGAYAQKPRLHIVKPEDPNKPPLSN